MNKIAITTLKVLRKIYTKTIGNKNDDLPQCEQNPDIASKLIFDALMAEEPCMIARFGSNELLCIVSYFGVKKQNKNIISYITGRSDAWWWNKQNLENMHYVAGFFPPTINKYKQFCELMLEDMPQVDVLGSWVVNEKHVKERMHATKVHLRLLEPFWSKKSWTKALKGKKVLVVHPFTETIEKQYKKRVLLFDNDVLPEFELITLKSVQSLAGNKTKFKDWFEALDFMKAEIDKTDYDICLIGAGAYGFPLAAHVKRQGKKAVHLGGALQLLFGIKGKRWEDPNYGVTQWNIPNGFYTNLINEHWVRPNEAEKPKTADKVEGACYW